MKCGFTASGRNTIPRWAVVHLTSEETKFVIGAGLAVDGGNTVLDGS